VVPNGKVLPGAFVLVNVETEQLSDAVGGVHVATASHPAVAESKISVGQPVITGLILSFTVTVNEHAEIFPFASVAVYVTVVIPSGKVLPGVLLLVNVESEQLSEAVGGVQDTTAWQDAFAVVVTLPGQPLITGLVLSLTVTLKEHVEVFPDPSVAV
jgi:hypothetical protein